MIPPAEKLAEKSTEFTTSQHGSFDDGVVERREDAGLTEFTASQHGSMDDDGAVERREGASLTEFATAQHGSIDDRAEGSVQGREPAQHGGLDDD